MAHWEYKTSNLYITFKMIFTHILEYDKGKHIKNENIEKLYPHGK